jgi:hypothetical protein
MTAASTRELGHPVSIVVRRLIVTQWLWIGLVLFGFALLFAIIGTLVGTFGHLGSSMVETATGGGPKYLALMFGVIGITGQLGMYAAHGVTRRHFMLASLIFAVLIATVTAVFIAIGYLVERALYTANDLMAGLKNPYPGATTDQLLGLVAQNWLVFLAHLIAGYLAGVGYLRFGTVIGTLFLSVAAIPVLVTEALSTRPWIGMGVNAILGTKAATTPVAIGVSVGVVAVSMVITYLLVRNVPIPANNQQQG